MIAVEWSKLQALQSACVAAGVGFSLNYQEVSDEWWITIESSAPGERFMSKTRGFDTVIAYALEHLESLKA